MTQGQIFLTETLKSMKGLKSNVEKALAQITGNEYHYKPDSESNSVAIIMKHMSGNMLSRFTDFLTTDGEKPNRNRDDEFVDDFESQEQLQHLWEKGWQCVFDSIEALTENDLTKTVFIRNEPHSVVRALQRQLTHYAYHAGQIVFLCKHIRSTTFQSLSIPKAQSNTYTPPPSLSSS
jgi:hypothetical protein